MSLEQEIFAGSFQSDEDESLKSKGGNFGVFGLNTGAKITKFEYNAKAGKDGADGDALDIEVTVGENKKMMQRLFAVSKVFAKDSTEITDTASEAYIKGFNEQVKHQRAVITHYLKIFYTEEEIAKAFASATIKGFVDFYKFVTEAIKIGIQRKGPEVDVFLQYQWNISKGQDKTYLELPKNMKDGAFICKPIPAKGEWKEVRDADGLHYEDEAGAIHRFKKDKNFLDSNKGKQQTTGTSSSAGGAAMNSGTPTPAAGGITGGW